VPAREGDVFLLCSDGLSGMVSDGDLAAIIGAGEALDSTAKTLVEAANAEGGRDNITAVLFRLADDRTGDDRAARVATDSYDTIAGDQEAPTADQIEAERRRISELDTQAQVAQTAPTMAATAVRIPPRASPRVRPPEAETDSPSRPRPAARRRGRWLPRAIVAAIVIVALAVAAVAVVSHNVYFVGTNNDGLITLYRGLPYDLPFGVQLYERYYRSGVTLADVPEARRARFTDHQLRSRDDAEDLVIALEKDQIE
jgi:PPM family protein phosphatase